MSTVARTRLPDYEHLLGISARGSWDPDAIDLHQDLLRWPSLGSRPRRRLLGLLAGFLVGEQAVAEHLAPFALAAEDPRLAAVLRAQHGEEERHARAIERLWAAFATPGQDPRELLDPGFVALFHERLPAIAATVGDQDGPGLGTAVALYHGLLEGVIFLAGQHALVDLATDHALPGLTETVERIQRDERWHVSLGMRILVDRPDGPAVARRLADEAPAAVAGWGDLVDPALRDDVVAALGRRLRTVGLAGVDGADAADPSGA